MAATTPTIEDLQKKIVELEAFKSRCKCQGPKKKQQQKKKKKKNKVCKTDLVIKVAPDDIPDFDWKTIETEIRKIDIDGLTWATVFPLEDFVFGLKTLQVGAQIEDLMVPETAPVAEAIAKINGVKTAEVVNIQTAQNDWGGKSSGKAKKKKKGGKKGKKEEVLTIGEKEIQAAADKVCMLARAAEVYVTGVPAMDRSGAMDVTEEQLREVAKRVAEKKPDLLFAVIAAGKTACSAVAVIPASYADKPGSDASALVDAGFDKEAKVNGDKKSAYGTMVCDHEAGLFSIKEKDNVMTQMFNYISSSGLCPDSESEEDSYIGLTSDDEE